MSRAGWELYRAKGAQKGALKKNEWGGRLQISLFWTLRLKQTEGGNSENRLSDGCF